MKKKLAILLSAVMVAGLIPMTALAGSTTYVNKTITVEKGDLTGDTSLLTIKDNNNDIDTAIANLDPVEFTLELEGAEWRDDVDVKTEVETYETNVTFTKVSSKKAAISIDTSKGPGGYYYIPLYTIIKDKGDVTVTLDAKSSVVSGGTYTYAVAISGAATAKVGGTVNIPETGCTIKDITISETSAGALEDGQIKLKLSKNFKFGSIGTMTPVLGDSSILGTYYKDSDRELIVNIAGAPSANALEFILKSIEVVPDDAKIGAVAEITVSGAGMTKTTLEVGTYVDYGVKIAIYDEDEEMPTFYAGKVYDEEDDVTLAVIVSENVANSINTGRKMTFTFPEGVKVTTAYGAGAEGIGGTGIYDKDNNDKDAWDKVNAFDYEVKNNVVTIKNMDIVPDQKAKMTFAFNLAISPEFAGDVDVVVGGAALDNEQTLTVAKVIPGFSVEADVNEVAIDYRNVAASNIVIKEAEPGVFEDDDHIHLAVENMQFEKGMDYEVTAGDIEVDDLSVDTNDGFICVELKEESVKAAGEITLSNVQLYLNRSLPAGDYDLIAQCDGWSSLFESTVRERKADTPYFDIDDVTLVKGYVKVVTAGRDVDDSTFTTKISVPVGSYTITAGEREIAIDVPAFINADGYTMMPLRAVVEALSGTAIVTWDNATKTATVLFGARVISMTIGEKQMVINGVNVAMLAAPVIVESRTFLPLRDLGYALGLNESQVNWDAETKTATLN